MVTLGKAGIEPELVDFFLDAAVDLAPPPAQQVDTADAGTPETTRSTWALKTNLFLEALAKCPRFSIALLFSSSAKLAKVKQLLGPESAKALANWK